MGPTVRVSPPCKDSLTRYVVDWRGIHSCLFYRLFPLSAHILAGGCGQGVNKVSTGNLVSTRLT